MSKFGAIENPEAVVMSQFNGGDSLDLDTHEYQAFSAFLQTACGIDLGANKQYLVATRVRRILVEHHLRSLGELTRLIQQDSQRLLRQKVIDAMTTNETFWFRDSYPFEYLSKTVLPALAKQQKHQQKTRIWSAACSSGQEPYSLSMLVEEGMRGNFSTRCNDAEILATDVSASVLESAKQAVYDRISLARGLSLQRCNEFFVQTDTDSWVLKDSVRNRVRFRPLNLQESFYLLGRFDVVFCRNVLIYFSTDLKAEILRKIHGVLNPGGILFLGSSESISGLSDLYEMVNCNPGVAYRAKGSRTSF
jgi:chemotaxis protein methyltransferase CheR